MTTDYIPTSYKTLRDWLQTQHDQIPANAPTIGMSGDEQTIFLNSVNILLASANDVVDLMDKLDRLTADLQALEDIHLPIIRQGVKRGKTHSGYTPGLGQLLGWIGGGGSIDPAISQPSISVSVHLGKIHVDGQKPGFEAVTVYRRRKGEPDWTPVAIRKRKFPIIDDAPLAILGTPEVREYRAVGIMNDEEIGQPSVMVEIVFAG
ncbi:MAG: hypothetical protein PHE55_07165 [Methylococcaceae bacterium]|nr:hypothetical protein [Methylococcaceae bacterium]